MSQGNVETFAKRGQWVNRVKGEGELSESFTSRDEAIEAGRRLAQVLGTEHEVTESEPTGVITDEEEDGT